MTDERTSPGESMAEDDFPPRGGPFGFFVKVLGLKALGLFMAILDIQTVAASLPEMQAGVSAPRPSRPPSGRRLAAG